jgi:sulfur-oxidizing protein SoxZ
MRALMTHPMTTAQSNQPLHFIQNITVKQNGKAVVEAQISQAISRNPVFTFRINGGAKGDKIEVSWLDNKGETSSIEAAVA